MTQPPSDPPKTLDYQKPPRSPARVVFLILSLVFAFGVFSLCALAVGAMLDDHHPDFVIILASCPLGLGIIAFLLRRSLSLAAATAIISAITLLLMIGLCSQVTVRI